MRSCHALCNFKGKYIYASGGSKTENGVRKALKSVNRFDIANKQWKRIK